MNKLIKKYNELSLPVKASFWLLCCSILQQGLNFIITPLFTRLLSTSEYGLVSIYNSWSYIFIIFASLNLGAGVLSQGLIKYQDEKYEYLSCTLGLSTVVALVCLAVFMFFSDIFAALTGLSYKLLLLMFSSFIVTPALTYYTTFQKFEYKYKFLTFVTVASSLLTTFCALAAVIYSNDKAFAKIFVTQGINILISLGFYIYLLTRGKKFFNWQKWKFDLSMGIVLIPHYLSGILLSQCDRVMIDKMVGRDAAGIYSVAYTIGMILTLFMNAATSSFNPWVLKKLSKEEYNSINNTSSTLLIGMAVLNLMICLFSPEIMLIIAPAEYHKAMYIIPALSLSVVFQFYAQYFTNVEFSQYKAKYISIASFVTAFTNIVLNALFIPLVGFLAAGYTTLASYMIFALMHYFFAKRIQKNINEIYNIRHNMIVLMGTVIISLALTFIYDYYILRYGLFLILSISLIVNRKKFVGLLKRLESK